MNLDELRAVQSKERQTDSLQHLRESFYEEAAAFIAELEAERERVAAQADDPFASPEVRQLTDEIETAREVVEAIYERRLGKLVKNASLAAADIPADEDGLTAEERALFEDLVERIERNKSRVLDVLDGETDVHGDDATPGRDAVAPEEAAEVAGPADEPGPGTATGPPADAATRGADHPDAADAMGPGPDAAGPAPGGDHSPGATEAGATDDQGADERTLDEADERTTVRVTSDVEQFYGVDDREYDLDPEDVVALPAANAEPLLQRGAAERLE